MKQKKNRRSRKKTPGVLLTALVLFIALAGGYTALNEDLNLPDSYAVYSTLLTKIRNSEFVQSLLGTGKSSSAPEGFAVYTDGELPTERNDQICVTVLDVGQGLSLLVKVNDHYMIYDGGGRSTSSYVVSYLRKHDVTDFDYLFASHYDEDHIAGLVGVLNTTNVETAVTPDYETDTKIYRSFKSTLESNGVTEVHPTVGETFDLDDATIHVLGPDSYDNDDKNDNSIVVRITYGDFSCIITGDAGEDEEDAVIHSGYTIDSDVYVVGHHGSSSSSSEEFIQAMSPEYAIISVGADNKYGHPTAKILNALEASNVAVYRTDLNGEITICYTK